MKKLQRQYEGVKIAHWNGFWMWVAKGYRYSMKGSSNIKKRYIILMIEWYWKGVYHDYQVKLI